MKDKSNLDQLFGWIPNRYWFWMGVWLLFLLIASFFVNIDYWKYQIYLNCFRLIFGVGCFAAFAIFVLKSAQGDVEEA